MPFNIIDSTPILDMPRAIIICVHSFSISSPPSIRQPCIDIKLGRKVYFIFANSLCNFDFVNKWIYNFFLIFTKECDGKKFTELILEKFCTVSIFQDVSLYLRNKLVAIV